MKKIISFFVLISMLFSLSACGNDTASETENSKQTVGIAMPTNFIQRWNQDGSNMKEAFEKEGYKVNLQYANGDTDTQIQQIENMIISGCDLIVIGSIDGSKLVDVIKEASDKGIKIISYDRLIMGSENIDYYVTFDNYEVGKLQGQYVEEKLGLKNGNGPFNFELVSGSPDDNNANFFFKGAMDILKPYIDNGKLVIKSGQSDLSSSSTLGWSTDLAAERMDKVISMYGPNEKIDAILSASDSCSTGAIIALKKHGYGKPEKPFPLLTGQDSERLSIISVLKGEQSMSIFKDTRVLSQKTVEMAEAILQGKEPEVNDTKTYDNGKKVVPSYLCQPVSVDASNYKNVLIDSGYYTADDLKY